MGEGRSRRDSLSAATISSKHAGQAGNDQQSPGASYRPLSIEYPRQAAAGSDFGSRSTRWRGEFSQVTRRVSEENLHRCSVLLSEFAVLRSSIPKTCLPSETISIRGDTYGAISRDRLFYPMRSGNRCSRTARLPNTFCLVFITSNHPSANARVSNGHESDESLR